MSMIATVLPTTAATYPTSFGNPYPPAYDGKTGSVTGRVMTSANSTGIGRAYIAVVNASNTSEEYFNTSADPYGYYLIIGLNATYSSVLGRGSPAFAGDPRGNLTAGKSAYKIYANKSPYGEGYSNEFGIDANESSSSTTSVVIFTKPARIELRAEKTHVIANGVNNIKLTAYMYDALDNPVGDGNQVNFTVGNVTNCTWLEGGFPIYQAPANGSFNGDRDFTNLTRGGTGSTNAQFGWVARGYGGNNSTIWAFINGTNIYATVKIYFTAPTASWTGYVVDSVGTGYGGIPVKLHIMNNSTEMYNMTRTTSSLQPFVGLFAFDYIIIQGATHGYVDAEAQLTDNLTIYGASDNYTMNETRTSSGFIVLQIPPPDAIKVTAEKDTILVGGESDWIIAQLYLNGLPYKRASVAVTFSEDNVTVATLPKVKTNITDLNGQAMILLTSNQTVGKVNITGAAPIMHQHNLTDTCMVRVVGWGMVSGIVTDMNRVGIPNANVTLWNVKWNETLGRWENTKKVNIPENPQLSNDGRTAARGMYTYYKVPYNVYNVTGEREGHIWYAVFVLGPWPSDVKDYTNATDIPGSDYGTATHNIAIPDYSFITPTSPTPPPVSPTPTPVPSPSVSVKPTPGFETLFALAGLLGVAYLIARKEN